MLFRRGEKYKRSANLEENKTKQFEKGSFEHDIYLRKNMKYKGEEIPKNVPFMEYSGYIIRNFKDKKPEEEWTDEDYKAHLSTYHRLLMSAVIKKLGKQKEPLTARQKKMIEMVRDGTDFHSDSWKELLKGLQ